MKVRAVCDRSNNSNDPWAGVRIVYLSYSTHAQTDIFIASGNNERRLRDDDEASDTEPEMRAIPI